MTRPAPTGRAGSGAGLALGFTAPRPGFKRPNEALLRARREKQRDSRAPPHLPLGGSAARCLGAPLAPGQPSGPAARGPPCTQETCPRGTHPRPRPFCPGRRLESLHRRTGLPLALDMLLPPRRAVGQPQWDPLYTRHRSSAELWPRGQGPSGTVFAPPPPGLPPAGLKQLLPRAVPHQTCSSWFEERSPSVTPKPGPRPPPPTETWSCEAFLVWFPVSVNRASLSPRSPI